MSLESRAQLSAVGFVTAELCAGAGDTDQHAMGLGHGKPDPCAGRNSSGREWGLATLLIPHSVRV